MKPAGIILAGGLSSRMGGQDKAQVRLHGRTLLAHVAVSLTPQVEALAINSNGDPGIFADFQLPVIGDCLPGRQGPLAGILTGMLWARQYMPHATHLLSAPCDIPGLPGDISTRLENARNAANAHIAIACDDDGPQPTIGLWPLSLAEQLIADMVLGVRGIQAWMAPFGVAQVHCHGLHNINTPEDLRAASNPSFKDTHTRCAVS